MERISDVVIIGGGVIGCAIAYYLRKLGVSVALFEQGEIGGEASSAAAGLLAPLGPLSGPGPLADLVLRSWSMFPALVAELEAETGIQLEYRQTGALRVARTPKAMSNLKKRMQSWQPLGLEMHWLSGDEARQREPLLSPEVCAAVYAPQESQIRAPRVVQAFATAASKLGAKLHPHIQITYIHTSQQRITAVSTAQGQTFLCQQLILATGAWSAELAHQLSLSLPVTPQKGQMLTIAQTTPALRHLIFGEGVYLAPKTDQTILIGATKEEAGFDKQVTETGISRLYSTGARLVPITAFSTLCQSWAGLRPRTSDNLPILGKVPGWENLLLAVGHGSMGIMLSPLTAQGIAQMAIGQDTPKAFLPCSIERFHT